MQVTTVTTVCLLKRVVSAGGTGPHEGIAVVTGHLQKGLVCAAEANGPAAAATGCRKCQHQRVRSEQKELVPSPDAAGRVLHWQAGKCPEVRPHCCQHHRILHWYIDS